MQAYLFLNSFHALALFPIKRQEKQLVKVTLFGDYNIWHYLIIVDFSFARAFCLLSVFITCICRRLFFAQH